MKRLKFLEKREGGTIDYLFNPYRQSFNEDNKNVYTKQQKDEAPYADKGYTEQIKKYQEYDPNISPAILSKNIKKVQAGKASPQDLLKNMLSGTQDKVTSEIIHDIAKQFNVPITAQKGQTLTVQDLKKLTTELGIDTPLFGSAKKPSLNLVKDIITKAKLVKPNISEDILNQVSNIVPVNKAATQDVRRIKSAIVIAKQKAQAEAQREGAQRIKNEYMANKNKLIQDEEIKFKAEYERQAQQQLEEQRRQEEAKKAAMQKEYNTILALMKEHENRQLYHMHARSYGASFPTVNPSLYNQTWSAYANSMNARKNILSDQDLKSEQYSTYRIPDPQGFNTFTLNPYTLQPRLRKLEKQLQFAPYKTGYYNQI